MNKLIFCSIFFLVWLLWIVYEIWRAPLLEEGQDGNWIVKKPAKKLTDLFK